MTDNVPLITKYRPSNFDEMVGHEAVLGALQRVLASSSRPHAYLFTGPAGLGKTTLARIVGTAVEAEILEIDAAANNGIDAMRELIDTGAHLSMIGNGRRMFIIDECHALSKAAWQAILKIVEEPPDHLFFALCTTEFAKVPETIVSRCYHTALRPLKPNEMSDLLGLIADLEQWTVNPDVMSAVVQASNGQPRKGISLLQSVHDVASRSEVSRIISLMDAGTPIHDLCQQLLAGKGWSVIQPILARIEDDEFESAPLAVGGYLAAVMVRAETEAKARRAWILLEALLFPANSYDRRAAFLAAVGRMLFAE